MDLVDDRSPFILKETDIAKTSGGWIQLARDIDAVILFGSGFEDVIRPSEQSMDGLCHMWKSVPKGKDYLTVSVPMMNQLYERAGSRLNRKQLTSTHLRWHSGGQLWERCEHANRFSCTCSRLQQVVSGSSAKLGAISDPGLLEEKGAVIFGQASDPLISTVSALMKPKVNQEGCLYSQPNVELVITDTPAFPGSNLSVKTGTGAMPIAPFVPTSDEDDQDSDLEELLNGPASSRFIGSHHKSGPSHSRKRSHSGEELKPVQQHHRRRKKRSTEQRREAEIQTEAVVSSSALSSKTGKGSVATMVEMNTNKGNDIKKLSLRH